MSDLKKIRDEFTSKLKGKLDLAELNQIKSDLFGKNGLVSSQFKKIEEFFTTMPKLSHNIKVKNPNTKVESEVVLEGLASFFG